MRSRRAAAPMRRVLGSRSGDHRAAGLREERHHAACRQARAGVGAAAEAAAAHRRRDVPRLRASCCRHDPTGDELTAMLDAITTNHTAFFREPQHFEFLAHVVLPPLRDRSRVDADPRLERGVLDRRRAVHDRDDRCAACSATTPAAACGCWPRIFRRGAIARAAAGVYRADRLGRAAAASRPEVLPEGDRRAAGLAAGHARRSGSMIEFRQLNLLQPAAARTAVRFHLLPQRHDLFRSRGAAARDRRARARGWRPAATCSSSHSESLNGLRHGLTWVAPAIYRRGER